MRRNRLLIVLIIIAAFSLVLGGGLLIAGQALGGNQLNFNFGNWWHKVPITINTQKYNGPYENKTIDLDSFTSLELDLSMLEIEIKQGDDYRLELIDVPQDTLKTAVLGSNLRIYNTYKQNIDYGIGDIENKIILTIPEVELEKVVIDVAMGELEVKSINTKDLDVEGSMTAIFIKDVVIYKASLESSMANIDFEGKLLGDLKVNSSMADVDIKIKGKAEDYAYSISSSMGSVNYDRRKVDGISSSMSGNESGIYHITIDNSMGDVDVVFE